MKNEEMRAVDHSHIREASEKNYIPEGFDSVEEFVADMRQEYALDVDAEEENRKQAYDDKKFAAGEQWDERVLEQRKGLPCLVINAIPQFTAQLVGDWREGRKGIKVVPTEDGDVDTASIRSDLIRSIEQRSRASRVYDSAFESAVQCGEGAFRVSVEYAKNDVFDQDIFIRPIEDALSVVWDRLSVDPTGRDARRVFIDDLIPEKEFNRKYPDKKTGEMGATLKRDLVGTGWIENETVRVTEYWRLIERDRLLTLFQDGSVRVSDAENLSQLIEKHGQAVRSRVSAVTYAQMHLVTGFDILSGPFEYQLDRVPVLRMTGRVVNLGGRRIRHGLVRFMKDSVRLKNFWRSVAAEQLGYAPKAQWLMPESAISGREDEWRKAHLSRDPLLIFNDDATERPQRLDPPVPQAALLNEAQVNAQDMKDVTGIHDASLGIKSNETSGRAISARQREGDIASLTYYDNGNAAVLEAGDVINQLISQVYDGTRIIRVVGDDEEQRFMKVNDEYDPSSPDLSVGRYDVALQTGASYTTKRVEAAQAMMDAVQVWPQLMGVAGDLVAKAQDWPGADKLAERLKKTIPPHFLEEGEGGPQMTPEMMQQLQMEMQTLKEENQALKDKREIEEAKLKIDSYNAETQRIRALSDHQVDGNKMEMDAIDRILNMSDSPPLEDRATLPGQGAPDVAPVEGPQI